MGINGSCVEDGTIDDVGISDGGSLGGGGDLRVLRRVLSSTRTFCPGGGEVLELAISEVGSVWKPEGLPGPEEGNMPAAKSYTFLLAAGVGDDGGIMGGKV